MKLGMFTAAAIAAVMAFATATKAGEIDQVAASFDRDMVDAQAPAVASAEERKAWEVLVAEKVTGPEAYITANPHKQGGAG